MTAATDLARPLVQRFESCRLEPYLDPVGIPTIGWGATALNGQPVTMATAPITQAEADAALDDALAAVETRVLAMVHVALADHETAALISFAYNTGTGALGRSTLLRMLNGGERTAAATQFMSWVYADGRVMPGLVARRQAERALFVGADAPPPPAPQPAPTTDDAADTLNAAELTQLQQEPNA